MLSYAEKFDTHNLTLHMAWNLNSLHLKPVLRPFIRSWPLATSIGLRAVSFGRQRLTINRQLLYTQLCKACDPIAAKVNCRRTATAAAPMAAAASHEISTKQCTEIIVIEAASLDINGSRTVNKAKLHPGIARAAAVLAAGDVVAMPTETVYGLAANALSASAVSKIYAAKNRPADNPLIIHVSSLEMLTSLYPPGWTLPAIYEPLLRDLWPGPLTILLPRSPLVPDAVTCGLPTMAVRMPSHPVALALIAACGFPLAAPSANSSGRPSPTLACHVLADLINRIPLVLDGGPCTCGVESTVLDGLRQPPAILRPGGVTPDHLSAYPGLGGLRVYRRDFQDAALEAAPTTPGMKYRHYSPSAQVLLLDPGDPPSEVGQEELAERLARGVAALLAELRGRSGGGGDREGRGLTAAAGGGGAGVLEEGRETQPQDEGVEALGTACARRNTKKGEEASAGESEDPGGAAQGLGALGSLESMRGHEAKTGQHQHQREEVCHQQLVVGVLRTSLAGVKPGPLLRAGGEGMAAAAVHNSSGHQHHATSGSAHPDLHPSLDDFAASSTGHQPSPSCTSCTCYEYVLGHVSRPEQVAAELFAGLRHLDDQGVGVIVVEGMADRGAGMAVMNRLRKAASRVVRV